MQLCVNMLSFVKNIYLDMDFLIKASSIFYLGMLSLYHAI
jgi:hypothetical protein